MKQKAALRALFSLFTLALVVLCTVPFFEVFRRGFLQGGQLTAQNYYEVFLAQPQYLYRFWKSLLIGVCTVAGQVIVSVTAGFGFARFTFPGKRILFSLLLVFIVLPVQVTVVPNYIILEKLHLLGTSSSLILPGIFSPLGIVLLCTTFRAIPDAVFEAAELDGCGTLRCITSLAIPMNPGGVICVGLLSFLDTWNLVEQPIAFLNDFADYPLSVALAYRPPEEPGVQMVCCVLALLPGLFLFLLFHQSLIDGIVPAEEK